MPKGPKGEKRPADVIGAAVMVGRIATREILDVRASDAAIARGRLGGKKGGKARAAVLSPTERTKIAKQAAKKRWRKTD